MQDDRLDRRIVIKLLKLVDYRLGKDLAVKVDYANAVAEAAESSLVAAGVQRQINQENTASTKRKNAPPPIRTQSRVWNVVQA